MAAASRETTPAFRLAIAKLTQALPDPIREEAKAAVASIVTDDRAWGDPAGTAAGGADANSGQAPNAASAASWLDALQTAILQRRRVELGYERPGRPSSRRVIEPLGLVAKRGVWYVVAGTDAGRRTFRLDRIVAAEVLDERFEVPETFDLQSTWREITDDYLERSGRVAVEATVDDWALVPLRSLGVEVTAHGPVDDGAARTNVTLGSWNEQVLATQLAGLVAHVELHDPPPDLVERLAVMGRALVDRYG